MSYDVESANRIQATFVEDPTPGHSHNYPNSVTCGLYDIALTFLDTVTPGSFSKTYERYLNFIYWKKAFHCKLIMLLRRGFSVLSPNCLFHCKRYSYLTQRHYCNYGYTKKISLASTLFFSSFRFEFLKI